MDNFKLLFQTTPQERTTYASLFVIFFLLGFIISVGNAQITPYNNHNIDACQIEYKSSVSVPMVHISK